MKNLEELISFLQNIKADTKAHKLDILGLNQTILLPLFQKLGWNIFDIGEVIPESRHSTEIRYTLKLDQAIAVILELTSNPQAFNGDYEGSFLMTPPADCKLLCLTNGIRWQFSLPKKEEEKWWSFLNKKGPQWTAKLIPPLDLEQWEARAAAAILYGLISRDQLRSGEFTRAAESYLGQARKQTIDEALLKAWQQLIAEPSPTLTNLLATAAEKLCDLKLDPSEVLEFLKNQLREPPAAIVDKKPTSPYISEPLPPKPEPRPLVDQKPPLRPTSEPLPPIEELLSSIAKKPTSQFPPEPLSPRGQPPPPFENTTVIPETEPNLAEPTPPSTVILQWGRKLANDPRYAGCKDRQAIKGLLEELAAGEFNRLPADEIIDAAGNIHFFSVRQK